ncbi:INSYN2B protein-like [Struthio camelus]|uniref:INSYN2B protein-like n=1 Tax=Struthio camelus TaxID=8801 RepID=UPI00360410DF
MPGREPEPGPGPAAGGQEKAATVRSVLLNRDSPDVESRRQRRRHRAQQVRFKDPVEGGGGRASSPPAPPAAPRASPPAAAAPAAAAPRASAARRSWPQARAPPARATAAIQTSPSLRKPFPAPRARRNSAGDAARAEAPGGAGLPATGCGPPPPRAPGPAHCGGCSADPRGCPRPLACAGLGGGPPRPASVPCGRPPGPPRRLGRSDSEQGLPRPDPPARPGPRPQQAAPAADSRGRRAPARASPPPAEPPPPAPGPATLPPEPAGGPCARPAEPCLAAEPSETLRHVRDLLQLVAAADWEPLGAPAGDERARTSRGRGAGGPRGPGDRGDLQSRLQSLEGVLETSQQTIRVLLDVIQDLEKKEAQRDGRHSYRTGQDIANCGTCRDCACIIYSVEHDFRQQEGRLRRVLSSLESEASRSSPAAAGAGLPGGQEPAPASRLPAKLDSKKSRRKCFWFL